jgi:phosphoglycolate phosphatase
MVLCGDQIMHMKPHPQILRIIMKTLGVSKKETLYIGDMTVDVETGKRAGVFTVAVPTGSSTKKELADLYPDRLLPRAAALAKLLDTAGNRHIIERKPGRDI